MKNVDFVAKLIDLANNRKTYYALGFVGQIINDVTIVEPSSRLAWYTDDKIRELLALPDEYYGFDCICMIKAMFWGWTGDKQAKNCGTIVGTNEVMDVNTEGMLAVCNNISTDFTTIVPGEYLWMQGHAGIYIGNGQAVECTFRWNNGVQITSVYNIDPDESMKGRYWTKHAKLPYLTYPNTVPVIPVKTPFKTEQLMFMQNIRSRIITLINKLK